MVLLGNTGIILIFAGTKFHKKVINTGNNLVQYENMFTQILFDSHGLAPLKEMLLLSKSSRFGVQIGTNSILLISFL